MSDRDAFILNTINLLTKWGIDVEKFIHKIDTVIFKLFDWLVEYEVDTDIFLKTDLILISLCIADYHIFLEDNLAKSKDKKWLKYIEKNLAKFKYTCIYTGLVDTSKSVNDDNDYWKIKPQQLCKKLLRDAQDGVESAKLFVPSNDDNISIVDNIRSFHQTHESSTDIELSEKWTLQFPTLFRAIANFLRDHGYSIPHSDYKDLQDTSLPFGLIAITQPLTSEYTFHALHNADFRTNKHQIYVCQYKVNQATLEATVFHEVAHAISSHNQIHNGIFRSGLTCGYKKVRFRGLNEAFTESLLEKYRLIPTAYPFQRRVLQRLLDVCPQLEKQISTTYFGGSHQDLHLLEVAIINRIGSEALLSLEFMQYTTFDEFLEKPLDSLILTRTHKTFENITQLLPVTYKQYIDRISNRFCVNHSYMLPAELYPNSEIFTKQDFQIAINKTSRTANKICFKLKQLLREISQIHISHVLHGKQEINKLSYILYELDLYFFCNLNSVDELEKLYTKLSDYCNLILERKQLFLAKMNLYQKLKLRLQLFIRNNYPTRKILARHFFVNLKSK